MILTVKSWACHWKRTKQFDQTISLHNNNWRLNLQLFIAIKLSKQIKKLQWCNLIIFTISTASLIITFWFCQKSQSAWVRHTCIYTPINSTVYFYYMDWLIKKLITKRDYIYIYILTYLHICLYKFYIYVWFWRHYIFLLNWLILTNVFHRIDRYETEQFWAAHVDLTRICLFQKWQQGR